MDSPPFSGNDHFGLSVCTRLATLHTCLAGLEQLFVRGSSSRRKGGRESEREDRLRKPTKPENGSNRSPSRRGGTPERESCVDVLPLTRLKLTSSLLGILFEF